MRITWRRSFFTALLKGWATKLPFNRLQNAISIEKSDGNSTPVTRRNEVYETAKESRYEFNKFINLLILISEKCDNGLKNIVLASLNRKIYWKIIDTKTLKKKLISSSICKIGIMMRWIIELLDSSRKHPLFKSITCDVHAESFFGQPFALRTLHCSHHSVCFICKLSVLLEFFMWIFGEKKSSYCEKKSACKKVL